MRSYLLAGACAASLLLILSSTTRAADIEEIQEEVSAGWSWYVSVFGGWSGADDLDVEFDTTFGGVGYNIEGDIDLENGFMAGLALGARINPWLRGEIEASGNWHDIDTQTAVFSFAGTNGATGTFTTVVDGDVNALFALANLWVDVPIGDVIRPYVGGGVGVGRLDVDLESTSGGAELIDGAGWGFAYQLGAGVAFDIMSNMAVDVGYRFKAINANDVDVPNDFFVPLSDADADYRSHNVLLGLRFSF